LSEVEKRLKHGCRIRHLEEDFPYAKGLLGDLRKHCSIANGPVFEWLEDMDWLVSTLGSWSESGDFKAWVAELEKWLREHGPRAEILLARSDVKKYERAIELLKMIERHHQEIETLESRKARSARQERELRSAEELAHKMFFEIGLRTLDRPVSLRGLAKAKTFSQASERVVRIITATCMEGLRSHGFRTYNHVLVPLFKIFYPAYLHLALSSRENTPREGLRGELTPKTRSKISETDRARRRRARRG
jgi:hypothetical protein